MHIYIKIMASRHRVIPPAEGEIYEMPDIKDDFEYINFGGSAINYTGLVRFRTPTGLDCFYHCLLMALSIGYRTHELHGAEMSERAFVKGLRRELTKVLSEKYDSLLDGKIKDMVHLDPSLNSVDLAQQLLTSMNVPKTLLPFVCDELDIDLYYVSAHNRDVFPVLTNIQDIVKGRRSVAVLYNRNHYELLGVRTSQKIRGSTDTREEFVTVFQPNHPFIMGLKHQLGL